MNALDQIMDILNTGHATADEIAKVTGFSRTILLLHLKALQLEGKIFKHGRSKRVYYSTSPKMEVRPLPEKPRIMLPDLPPIMLEWGGYTDKTPDPLAGRMIEGEY